MREAEAFKNELKGIKGTPVPGVTGGVKRYTKEGMYIDLDSKKRIVSFGSVNH
jgi:hypothetical protein